MGNTQAMDNKFIQGYPLRMEARVVSRDDNLVW